MKNLFTLLFLIVYAGNLFSQDDSNTKLLENINIETDYEKSNYVVVYDSTKVDVKPSGLSYVTNHKLVKILKPAGAKAFSLLTFNYDPLSADVDIRLAKIYRKSGSIEVVDLKSKTTDYPAPARAIYWGARNKSLEIGKLEPGDAVEYIMFRKGFTYALLAGEDDDSRFVPPMKGHYYDIVSFWTSVPVIVKTYMLALPEDKQLQYEVYNGELRSYVHFAPKQNNPTNVLINPDNVKNDDKALSFSRPGFYSEKGKTIYFWAKENIEPSKNEPGMVSHSDVSTKLLLSTSPDWYAKSLWFHKVNEDFGSFDVTPEVQKLTDEILDGVNDESEKISVLTHWSAENIRYSGISMGEGEGYTLHPGSMTFKDRCGVCKDKAGMLVTMLRAAGFESYPAMTMAGSRIDKIPSDQFNHSVTVVKRKTGKWELLDPTWVPGVRELWSSAEQQQQFLPGIPEGSDLLTTPISPAENHFWRLEIESKLSKNGTLTGRLILMADGQSDSQLRRLFSRRYRTYKKDYLPEVFYKVSSKSVVKNIKMTDIDDLSEPFTIKLNFEIPEYAIVQKNEFTFIPLSALNPFNDNNSAAELKINTTLEKRNYGFRTRCSKLVETEESIVFPSGYRLKDFKDIKLVDSEFSKFKVETAQKKNVLKIKSTHYMGKRIYESRDWPQFKKALDLRKEFMKTVFKIIKK